MTWRARASSTCRIVATSRWTIRELRDMDRRPGACSDAWAYLSAIAFGERLHQSENSVLAGGHVDRDPAAPRRHARDRPDTGDTDVTQTRGGRPARQGIQQ